MTIIEASAPFDDAVVEKIRSVMATDGYTILRGILPADASIRYGEAIFGEYRRLAAAGWKFVGGGHLEGHLNINPGEAGRELLDAANAVDMSDLISRVAGEPMHLTAMAGNLAMPGSHPQNFHPDSSIAGQTWVANIALVPTSAHNGAMELVAGTQAFGDSYGKFWAAKLARDGLQPTMQPGDVLLRLSSLWHRGTRNHSDTARPLGMLAFRPVADGQPTFTIPTGETLTIRSNRYYGKFASVRELAAIRLRPAYELSRIVTSWRR